MTTIGPGVPFADMVYHPPSTDWQSPRSGVGAGSGYGLATGAYAVFAFVALSSAFYFLFTGAADPRGAVQSTAVSNPG